MDQASPHVAYRLGLIFEGHFGSQEEADKAVRGLETYMTLELGFVNVRGGALETLNRAGETDCGCEAPEDCDRRTGCLFDD